MNLDPPWRVTSRFSDNQIELHVRDGVAVMGPSEIAILSAALGVAADLAISRIPDYDGAVPLALTVDPQTAARLRQFAARLPVGTTASAIAEQVVENYAAMTLPTYCFAHRAQCGDAQGRHVDEPRNGDASA